MVEGELKVRGPQPLAGPLPASVKANREQIIDFLAGCCRGVWPAAEGSGLRPVTTTCAPIAASATAVAFPMPEVPPVMRIVLPPMPPVCSTPLLLVCKTPFYRS